MELKMVFNWNLKCLLLVVLVLVLVLRVLVLLALVLVLVLPAAYPCLPLLTLAYPCPFWSLGRLYCTLRPLQVGELIPFCIPCFAA